MTSKQKTGAGIAAAVVLGAAAGVGIITSYEPGHVAEVAYSTGCCYDPTTQTSRQPLPMMGEGVGKCNQTATRPWEWRDPCPNVGTITLPTPSLPPVWTPPPDETPVPTPAPTAAPTPRPTPWTGGSRPLTPYDRVIVVGCAVEGQCWMSTTDPDGKLRFYGPWTATIELRSP
jgi:hypothetical protein